MFRRPRLVLRDVVVRGVSGIGLAGKARQRLPGLRRLLMSGYAAGVLSEDKPLRSVVVLVRAPFTVIGLLQALADLLKNGSVPTS